MSQSTQWVTADVVHGFPRPRGGARHDARAGLGPHRLANDHTAGADGVIYSAPSLIVHDMLAHAYLPPDEFQDAVLASVE